MQLAVALFTLQLIPVGILALCAFDGSFARRSRFGLRFSAAVAVVIAPDLILLAPRLGEPATSAITGLAFLWGLAMVAPARFALFHRILPGSEHGEDDHDGGRPRDEPPRPPSPRGGLVIAEIDPSLIRVRDKRRVPVG